VDRDDVHYTSAVAAHRLDGTVLWRWGNPKIGRKKLHHDVACQIYDWDGDQRQEVIVCTEGFLVELDGPTGKERRRLPLPKEATDCLVFANLSGNSRPTDVLVKTRYTHIWAFSREWKQLWAVALPGGSRTAHQPFPVDLDGDGREEIMAGYAMLNADGALRWMFSSEKADLKRGHLDCCRVLRPGKSPAQFRLTITCCGADLLAVIDGLGRPVWELTGHHFESINVGRMRAEPPGLQLAVDIDHRPFGQGPLWLLAEDGRRLGEIVSDYSRHHALLDWDGDGLDDVVIAHARGVFNGQGRRLGTFDMENPDDVDPAEMMCVTGDFTGDGVADVMLTTKACVAVYLYRNPSGRKADRAVPLGTSRNFTLY
jgi:hypothetical protein